MTDPAFAVMEAITRLQVAFTNAGLRSPVAIVVAGEIERRRLESLFLMLATFRNERPWEATTIQGIKVISDVAG